MRHSNWTSVGHAAEWLSARSGRLWTTGEVVERLIELRPATIGVALPPGWALTRVGDGERAVFARSCGMQVEPAVEFLEQFAMFADLSIATARADRLVDADGRVYRSAAPIPAAMVRIGSELLGRLVGPTDGKRTASFLERALGSGADAKR
ncbi:MAG: hypothetical protein GX576_08935 [Thauera phenolivorans]|uniref:Uncharacterized protein n=1 Tax=Thauera phenolivorans TaxID=1792543 RepID=A0A7X7LX64_9RHOO|nr:hypothetical protein [Thauera phenolivorans]NLF54501.1 hypothetical protein [Thauera phenolivorans]